MIPKLEGILDLIILYCKFYNLVLVYARNFSLLLIVYLCISFPCNLLKWNFIYI